jgi:hypothetical protein
MSQSPIQFSKFFNTPGSTNSLAMQSNNYNQPNNVAFGLPLSPQSGEPLTADKDSRLYTTQNNNIQSVIGSTRLNLEDAQSAVTLTELATPRQSPVQRHRSSPLGHEAARESQMLNPAYSPLVQRTPQHSCYQSMFYESGSPLHQSYSPLRNSTNRINVYQSPSADRSYTNFNSNNHNNHNNSNHTTTNNNSKTGLAQEEAIHHFLLPNTDHVSIVPTQLEQTSHSPLADSRRSKRFKGEEQEELFIPTLSPGIPKFEDLEREQVPPLMLYSASCGTNNFLNDRTVPNHNSTRVDHSHYSPAAAGTTNTNTTMYNNGHNDYQNSTRNDYNSSNNDNNNNNNYRNYYVNNHLTRNGKYDPYGGILSTNYNNNTQHLQQQHPIAPAVSGVSAASQMLGKYSLYPSTMHRPSLFADNLNSSANNNNTTDFSNGNNFNHNNNYSSSGTNNIASIDNTNAGVPRKRKQKASRGSFTRLPEERFKYLCLACGKTWARPTATLKHYCKETQRGEMENPKIPYFVKSFANPDDLERAYQQWDQMDRCNPKPVRQIYYFVVELKTKDRVEFLIPPRSSNNSAANVPITNGGTATNSYSQIQEHTHSFQLPQQPHQLPQSQPHSYPHSYQQAPQLAPPTAGNMYASFNQSPYVISSPPLSSFVSAPAAPPPVNPLYAKQTQRYWASEPSRR